MTKTTKLIIGLVVLAVVAGLWAWNSVNNIDETQESETPTSTLATIIEGHNNPDELQTCETETIYVEVDNPDHITTINALEAQLLSASSTRSDLLGEIEDLNTELGNATTSVASLQNQLSVARNEKQNAINEFETYKETHTCYEKPTPPERGESRFRLPREMRGMRDMREMRTFR